MLNKRSAAIYEIISVIFLIFSMQCACFANSPVVARIGPPIVACLDFYPVDVSFTEDSKNIFSQLVSYFSENRRYISNIKISIDNVLTDAKNFDTPYLKHFESINLMLGRQRYVVDQFYKNGGVGQSVLHDHYISFDASDVIASALPKCVALIVANTTGEFCTAAPCPRKVVCAADGCAPSDQ